jgi:hypothetical protein
VTIADLADELKTIPVRTPAHWQGRPDVEAMARLRREGLSLAAIGGRFGMSRQAVHEKLKWAGQILLNARDSRG